MREIDYTEFKSVLDRLIDSALTALKKKQAQFVLNVGKNIWILKPGGKSRGRGIQLFNKLTQLQQMLQTVRGQKWVVQKYIENPILLHKRKFDIRQWILITDWNPLTAWLFGDFYVRLGAHEYNPEDLKNRFIHLTNHAVTVKSTSLPPESVPQDFLLTSQQFREALFKLFNRNVVDEKILPQIKDIIIHSLLASQEPILEANNYQWNGRPFELFGYDIMVDKECQCWLLEVNSSPSLAIDSVVTENLVAKLGQDLFKVVLDYNRTEKASERATVDTGLFQLLYKSKKVQEKTRQPYPCSIVVEGRGYI